jgi:hypothetical protein
MHKLGCDEVSVEGTLVEGMWRSVSEYTAARVGKASQMVEAEIGRSP